MSSNNNDRISFSTRKNQLEYPDFLEVQLKSFCEFFQLGTTPENRRKEGLFKVFQENFPITDTRNNFVLEFLDYSIDPPRYAIEEDQADSIISALAALGFPSRITGTRRGEWGKPGKRGKPLACVVCGRSSARHRGRGLCSACYSRARREKTLKLYPTIEERALVHES